MTHKQIAREEGTCLQTAYNRYPVVKPQATQSQAILLRLQKYSIREIAFILDISKDRVFRWLS